MGGGGGEGFCMTVWASKEGSLLGIDVFCLQWDRNKDTHGVQCVIYGNTCIYRYAVCNRYLTVTFQKGQGAVWHCAEAKGLGFSHLPCGLGGILSLREGLFFFFPTSVRCGYENFLCADLVAYAMYLSSR